MNSDMLATYEQLLAVESTKLFRHTKAEVENALNHLVRTGNLHGSAGMRMVANVLAKHIPIEAQAAMNLMLRSMSAHGEAVNSDTRDEVKARLSGRIDRVVEELTELARAGAPFHNRSTAECEPFFKDLHDVAGLEKLRLGGEIDLIAAQSNKLADVSEARGHYVFNGPVGLVQTGPGSFGVAHQHIDQQGMSALSEALVQVVDLLMSLPRDAAIGEALELAEEAKAEAGKETPNATKIRSLVAGLGNAISFMPKTKAAYDTLKWAGAFVGINLP